MVLKVISLGKEPLYYVQKSYRKENGRPATMNYERLGTLSDLKARFGDADPVGAAKKYIAELTAAEKEERKKVVVEFNPGVMIPKGELQSVNGGYLFLQKIYYELGLDYICKKIEKRHRNKYDLSDILSTLIYTRILYPGSKRSSVEDAKNFLDGPSLDLNQIYRALSLMAQEMDFIQSEVYKRSLRIGERQTGVVYYDLTNYFFEWEEEGGLVQYGHCKEGRPLPIVQMGLFTDREGFPLAMCIEPGNTAETTTLKPLEEKLKEKFGLSRLVVCTDGGLSSYENRKRDSIGGRSFITVQSLKKLKGHLQEWALDCKGWKRSGSDEVYDLSELDGDEHYETLFYKERWDPTKMSSGGTLEQRIIVTFSFKYKAYLSRLRGRQVERAQAIVDKGGASALNKKSQNDARRFVKVEYATADGEVATEHCPSLDHEMIEQEARFDGFYGICTDLGGPATEIIRMNGGRWIIENAFRIMKSDFKARPVYLKRDDRIKAHFLTCFLSLLIYKYLEKRVNRGGCRFSPAQIANTLKKMNFYCLEGYGYIPTYMKDDLTNKLHGSAGFRTDYQIVTKKKMRSIISLTKRRDKKEDEL